MTVQYSTAVRIAILDATESVVGGSANLVFYSGTKPTLCSDAIGAATVVGTMALTGSGGDWMSPASAAANVVTKVKNPASTWTTAATAGGVVSFYRIYNTAMSVCHEQGTVTVTGGGGDITLDNTTVGLSQTLTVTNKTLTAGNA